MCSFHYGSDFSGYTEPVKARVLHEDEPEPESGSELRKCDLYPVADSASDSIPVHCSVACHMQMSAEYLKLQEVIGKICL